MSLETLRIAHRRARHGVPAGFPVAQFPNAPLLIALGAAAGGRIADGRADDLVSAVFFAALSAWAYGEVADGANWLRRLLGVAGLAYVVVRLAARL